MQLADAIKVYYTESNSKLLFCEKYSLNHLALLMSEKLNFRSVDSSVLSKVINGKRLFTPQQLEAFCSCLDLSKSEKEYLFFCLNQDQLKSKGATLDVFFSSSADVLHLLHRSRDISLQDFYNGDCNAVLQNSQVLKSFYSKLKFSNTNSSETQEYSEILPELLFLEGWAMGCFIRPEESISRFNELLVELSDLGKVLPHTKISTYMHYVNCLLYYAVSEYSYGKVNKYATVIDEGFQALEGLQDPNQMYLLLRNIVVSAHRTNDQNSQDKVALLLHRLLDKSNTILNSAGLHLLKNSLKNAFQTRKNSEVENLVREIDLSVPEDFQGKHIYAISDAKDKIESIQSSSECTYDVKMNIQRIVFLASEEHFTRQKEKILFLLSKTGFTPESFVY